MARGRLVLRESHGYAMAVLMVGIAVMAVLLALAMPTWRNVMQREREEELVFRGEQYVRAIRLYQRKFANAFPPSVEMLVDQKFLRKKYKDPVTKDGDFQLVYEGQFSETPTAGGPQQRPGPVGPGSASPVRPGQTPPSPALQTPGTQGAGPRGGLMGVKSKSKDRSIRRYNGREVYSEWLFLWRPTALQQSGPPQPGQAPPGRGGGRQGLPGPTRPGPIGPGIRPPG